MATNDVKVPISSRWSPGERVRRVDGAYEAVNLRNIEPDSSFTQQTLLAPLPPRAPRRLSLPGLGLVLYMAMAAVAAWYLVVVVVTL